MTATPPARMFSASRVLGSRAGSVGCRVAGAPGAAWVWCCRHRTAPASLALRLPRTATPARAAQLAAQVAARYGLRVSLRRAPCGVLWLKCQGHRATLTTAAHWWAAALAGGIQ